MRLLCVFFVFCFVSVCFFGFGVVGAVGVVTYNAGTNIITITGGTVSVPVTLEDVYNADVSGGWGVVFQTSYNQYLLTACFQVGDGSTATYFKERFTEIMFENCSFASDSVIIRVKNNAVFQLGSVISATYKTSYEGCSLGVRCYNSSMDMYHKHLLVTESGSTVYLYSCHLWAGYPRYLIEGSGKIVAWNCLFADRCTWYLPVCGAGSEVFNCNFAYFDNYGFGGVANQVTMSNPSFSAFWNSGSYSFNVSNCVVSGFGATIPLVRYYGCYGNLSLINVDSSDWRVLFYPNPYNSSGFVNRIYTLDLTVYDYLFDVYDGADVYVYDNSGLVWSGVTNSSGQIPTVQLLYGFYSNSSTNDLSVPAGCGVFQDNSPFLLVVDVDDGVNYDYQVSFVPDSKVDWSVVLVSSENVDVSDDLDYMFVVSGVIVCMFCVLLFVGLRSRLARRRR